MSCNVLPLNSDKTDVISFKNIKNPRDKLNATLDDIALNLSITMGNLGINFDQDISSER